MNVYAEGFKLKVFVGDDGAVRDDLTIHNSDHEDITNKLMTVENLTGGRLECGGPEGLWKGTISKNEIIAECMEHRLVLLTVEPSESDAAVYAGTYHAFMSPETTYDVDLINPYRFESSTGDYRTLDEYTRYLEVPVMKLWDIPKHTYHALVKFDSSVNELINMIDDAVDVTLRSRVNGILEHNEALIPIAAIAGADRCGSQIINPASVTDKLLFRPSDCEYQKLRHVPDAEREVILSAIAATTGVSNFMEAAGYYGLTPRDILKAVAPRAL